MIDQFGNLDTGTAIALISRQPPHGREFTRVRIHVMRLIPSSASLRSLGFCGILAGIAGAVFLAFRKEPNRSIAQSISVEIKDFVTNANRIVATFRVSNQAAFDVHVYGHFVVQRRDLAPSFAVVINPTNLPRQGVQLVSIPLRDPIDSDWRLTALCSKAIDWEVATAVERVAGPKTNLPWLCKHWYSRSKWISH